jgi:hypothetical protein
MLGNPPPGRKLIERGFDLRRVSWLDEKPISGEVAEWSKAELC